MCLTLLGRGERRILSYFNQLLVSYNYNSSVSIQLKMPIVQIDDGKLQGKISGTTINQFFTFKGIPYAKPPVGDLRFSVPVPPKPWEGIRDATKDCNICSQYDRASNCVVGDEDCLYLNVFTPKLPADSTSLLPVMAFIHGGGFVFGNGTDDVVHGPDYLVAKDVVVVTFNYRLGILGFLNLDRKDAPGNMGLRDQVQALKWIQKNIANFGGDPKNVTILGFSAGAASVEYLLLSPTANGLFHKAIAQSGSTLVPWANGSNLKELAYKIPAASDTLIKDDGELLKYLKDIPIEKLVTLSIKVIFSENFRGGIYFGFVPSVEKKGQWESFLDEKPYVLLSQGKFTKVPFMTGFCSCEGLIMVSHGLPRLEKMVKTKNFLDFLPFEIGAADKPNVAAKMEKAYLEGEQKYNDKDSFAIDFFSDVDFIGGAYVSMSLISSHSSPVYFYEFAYDGGLNYLKKKYNINREGACHGDDGGYLIKSEQVLGKNASDTDQLVRNRLLEMWTNFAKLGNPTPKIDNLITTQWKPVTKTDLNYLYIDENLTMKHENDLYPARIQLFKELYSKYNLI